MIKFLHFILENLRNWNADYLKKKKSLIYAIQEVKNLNNVNKISNNFDKVDMQRVNSLMHSMSF